VIGDWILEIGHWGLGPLPNPQSPIPNPQSPYFILIIFIQYLYNKKKLFIYLIKNNNLNII
jgi:hypothetical protein